MIKDKQSMPYKIRSVNPADLKTRVIFRRYLTQDLMPVLIADIQGIDIIRGLPQETNVRIRGRGQEGYVFDQAALLNNPFKGQNRLKRVLPKTGGEKGARTGLKPGQNPCWLIRNIPQQIVSQGGRFYLDRRMAVFEDERNFII